MISTGRFLTAAVLLVIGASVPLSGQTDAPVRFKRFSHADGLSDLTINAITQDSTGYLWIGTRDGLNRYDGERFKTFRNIPGDSTSLNHNNVQEVFVDSRGTLWVGTSLGISRYDPLYQTFRRCVLDSARPNVDIVAIVEDTSNGLWIGTAGLGLVNMDPRTEVCVSYRNHPSNRQTLSSNSIRSIVIDKEGYVWAGTIEVGLNRLDPRTGRVERFLHDPADPGSVGGGRIEALDIDPDGNLLVGTQYHGLNLFKPESRTFTRFMHDRRDPNSISSNWVSVLFHDRSGTFWVGTQGGGVCRLSRGSWRFHALRSDLFDPFSISDEYSQTIFQDKTGVIWIGTGSGLNKVLRYSGVFRHIANRPGGEQLLGGPSGYAVLKDRSGSVWVGTRSGLTRLDDGSPGSKFYLQGLHLPDGSRASDVGALSEDSEGNLWIGTNGSGLFQIRHNGSRDLPLTFKQWKHDIRNPHSLSDDRVYATLEDRSGFLWVGTDGGGLNRLDRVSGTFTRYQYDPANPTSIGNNIIVSLLEDSKGQLWVGTMRGMHLLDQATGTFTRFVHDESNQNGLPSNAVFGMTEDRRGKLWIATARGLSVFDPANKQFRNYFTAGTEVGGPGLPDVFLKGIVSDLRGNIWISSRSGLTRATEDSAGRIAFKNYGLADGLPVMDFSPTACSRASDGELFFGADNGLVRFFPDQLDDTGEPPRIAVTAFKVFDRERPLQSGLELSHREYHVAIEFTALDFAVPEKHVFEYKLEGLDDVWIKAGRISSAIYSNLLPGHYTFRVRGANSNGVWNMNGASFSFTILPPFWATWWFRLAGVLALAGLLVLAYRYRVRQLLHVERLRARIASDLHDELASNLSSIAMFGKIVQDETVDGNGDAGQRMVLLGRITSLAQESVHSIREIIWALDPKPESLHDLFIRVRDAAIAACNARGIKLHFSIPDRSVLPESNLSPEVRKNISLLMKEAITNAVKHSECTELVVELSMNGQTLTVKIQDNGRGFNPAHSHQGRGLKTTRARARALGSDLLIDSGPEKGTSVLFSVKIL